MLDNKTGDKHSNRNKRVNRPSDPLIPRVFTKAFLFQLLLKSLLFFVLGLITAYFLK